MGVPSGGGERDMVVPREPVLWGGGHGDGMPLQLGEVFERAGPTEFAGVDQAHVEVANVGAVLRFVKERVLTVKDCLFSACSQTLLCSGAPAFCRNSVSCR